jgi:hypothetical protein
MPADPTTFSPELRDLAALDADRLTERLARYFASAGGLALEAEKAIARELVRRARLLEGRDARPAAG